jgi:hypothetical protein
MVKVEYKVAFLPVVGVVTTPLFANKSKSHCSIYHSLFRANACEARS